MLSTFTNRPACVDEIAVATSMGASALLTIQAIYHDPKRAEWTTYEYIAYHILITWYASSSKTQIEKLCKLREIYYAMGMPKILTCIWQIQNLNYPRCRREARQNKHQRWVYLCWEDKILFPQAPKFHRDPMGRIQEKRILEADGGQTTQNNANSGEEQLIAFGEATVEDVGMGTEGTEKNSRTVTFELSQVPENRGLSTTSPPPLISSDNMLR